jgi:hypothetical protein
MIINKKHPGDAGLTYWQHLKFAWGEMTRLVIMAFVMFVHGLIPWILDWEYIEYIDKAKKRISPSLSTRK